MSAAPQRRLAAILAADIAGYSALMEADEAATVRDLKAHQAVLLPLIAGHGGRVIDLAGDGILAEFASAVSAVESALRLQAVMAERNAQVPPARAMRFRIAVHLGECVYDEVRLYGDGVNVASRLEAIAEPGGVCVSAAVREQVSGKIDARFVDLGEKKLKNIGHAVRAFSVLEGGKGGVPSADRPSLRASRGFRLLIAGGLAIAALLVGVGAWRLIGADPRAALPEPQTSAARTLPAVSTPEPPAMRRLSIVVLPFANLSNDPDQDYFADGITEDLTNDISRIAGSFVIARNTAFTYKGRTVDVRQIGRELNVRYALEGSVRRIDEMIRISAQLIDASSGARIWSDRFDVPRGRLAQLEGMVTGRIARALDLQLVSVEARRPRPEGAANADAEDLVLRGLDVLNRVPTPETLAQARRLLEQALAIDPGSADALAYLSQCHVLSGLYRFTDRQEATTIAERYARAALAIDPQHVRANQVLGQVFDIRHRFELAVGVFDRVIALNPSYSPAYFNRGRSRLLGGQRIEDAISDLEQALALSPRDSLLGVIYSFLGMAYWMQDRLEEAVQALERSVEANRAAHVFYPQLIAAYSATGRMTHARASLAEYLRLRPGATIGLLRSEINSDHPRYLALRAMQWEALRQAGLPD